MNQTMQMFGQMICLPMTAWEMMMKTMQGGMAASPCGPQACVPAWDAGNCCPPAAEPMACVDVKPRDWECAKTEPCCGTRCRCDGASCQSACPCRERVHHSGGDKVKLIEYTLARVANCQASKVLSSGQILVSECTSEEEVRNEIIVGYVNKHCKPGEPISGKDLRVYTKVLDCWCKPGYDYEEAQICALHGIEKAIDNRNAVA